jgi:excinuclease UvrABC ATPase subunit
MPGRRLRVSIEIPKRRLTVFTGVSGSGKSCLVPDTIAAESQRLINETYSAFVQSFMPTLAGPELDTMAAPTSRIRTAEGSSLLYREQPFSHDPGKKYVEVFLGSG